MSSRACAFTGPLLISLSTTLAIPALAAEADSPPAPANFPGAESDSGALQEITVTAQRRSERLDDVPITVKAVNAEELAAAGISSTSDLPLLTPGLVFGSQAGTAQPFLRGVGTVALGPGIENPVALYVDNVYYGAAAAGIMSFNNIDQVEVDKGPQGTLFGRNATGGLIQVTTRTPSHTFSGMVSGNYGDYATAGGDFYITGGLTDRLAADLAVHFQHQGDGYGKNIVTGQDVGLTQDLAARSKWLLQTDDGTRVTLIMDAGVTHFVPNYTSAPGTTPLGPPPTPLSSQDVAGIYQPFGETHQSGVSVDIQHDFDFARLVSITAYRRTVLDVQGSAQLTPDPQFAISTIYTIKNAQLTQEFQLLSPSGSRINWTTGAYLYADDAAQTPPAHIAGGLIAPLSNLDIFDHQKSYSGALYGQATTEIAPATNLTGGIRYTVERRDFRGNEIAGFPDGTSFETSDAQHKVFDKATWRLALDHHFAPDLMGYLSYNRGFKSGGFNDSLIPTLEFAPEVLDAFEAGMKTTVLDRHLSLDAAGFFYNYKGIQAFQYFENGSVYVYNAASAHLYGLDLDARWKVFEQFSLTTALEAMHSDYTSFPTAAISTPVPGGGTAYSIGSAAGHRLPLTPDITVSVTGDYTIPLDELGAFTLSATYAYNGGFYGEADNRLYQPSYGVVNAQGAWNSPGKLYTVRVWGKNLTNAEYTSSLGSQPNGDFGVFFPPRTYGVTVSMNF
jgi:iron complex outermembrane recepter protein